MAGTNGVDIELFHNADVLNHALTRNHVAAIGVHLVAVCALDEHRLTVDEELRVLDFHLAESRTHSNGFHFLVVLLYSDSHLV